MMPHERARAIRVEVLNAPLDTIATLATVNIGALSRHERGASGALSPAAIERVEQILNDLIAVKKKRFRGVPLDMSNIPFLRKQLREMGLDRPPAKIDQSLGGAKVTAAKRMVHIAKLPHCDYVKQVDMIKATLSRFGNPRALVDETGTGTAVVEMMRAKGIEVEEFTFTNDRR